MKRKLLSIALTLALLLGLMPVTGLLSAAAGVNLGTPVTTVDDLPTGTSLISGLIPIRMDTGTAPNTSEGSWDQATDGLIQGVNQSAKYQLTNQAYFTWNSVQYKNFKVPTDWLQAHYEEYGLSEEDLSKTWYLVCNQYSALTDIGTTRVNTYANDEDGRLLFDLGSEASVEQVMLAISAEVNSVSTFGNSAQNAANGDWVYGSGSDKTITKSAMENGLVPKAVSDSPENTFYKVDVYVGDVGDTSIVSADNLVLSYDNTSCKTDMSLATLFDVTTVKKGRYVCLDISDSAYGPLVRISELAVYGEQTKQYPVTTEGDLPVEKNVIAGKIPTTLAGGQVSQSTNSGGMDKATDGLVQGINQPIYYTITDEPTFAVSGTTYYRHIADPAYVAKYFPSYDQDKTWYLSNENNWYSATNASPTRAMIGSGANAKLVYDLGALVQVDGLLIASTYEIGHPFILGAANATVDNRQTISLAALESKMATPTKGASALHTVKVYVADKKADLENADNLVLSYAYDNTTMAVVSKYTIAKPVTGRYVHFDLSGSVNSSSVRISELGVYGTRIPSDFETTDNVTFLTDASDAALIPAVEANLLAGRTNTSTTGDTWYAQTNYKIYNTVTGALSSASIQNAPYMMDGRVYKVNSDSNAQGLFGVANTYTAFTAPQEAVTGGIVIDLGQVTALDKMLVGFATDSGTLMKPWFGRVYAGNSTDGLVSNANRVGSWSYVQEDTVGTVTDRGVILSLDGLEARYIAIVLPVNALGWAGDAGQSIRLSELGVYEVQDTTDLLAAHGAQVRTSASALPSGSGSAALRFGSTLTCADVALNGVYGDYSAATVTVGGVAYPIAEVGTLVARESAITRGNQQPETALVYGMSKTVGQTVEAKKIYSQATDKGAITFTAVVTNVPYSMYGEDLCARAYVRYTTPTGVKTLYGELITRNVYDVWVAKPAGREIKPRADYLNAGSGYFAQGSRVVFLGDSITNNGAFITEAFKYYAAQYPQDKVEMYMAGVKGGTAEGGLAFLEDQVLSLNPDYVSIMFGMNDIMREGYTSGYDNASAQQKGYIDTYAANMEEIVKALQAKGVKVILCTPTPFDETCTSANQWNYPGCFEALQVCAEKVHQLAATYGCEVVDFNAPMSEAVLYVQDTANGGDPAYTIIGTDHVHPGALGHDLMARIWLRTMGEAVTVPDNATLLSCVKGQSSPQTKFQDLGSEFSSKVDAVSSAGITGSANMAVCSYYEGEFFFVGPANHDTMTLQEKIDKVATYSGQYTGDWRGSCITSFPTNAANLGSNRYAVQQAIKGVYN